MCSAPCTLWTPRCLSFLLSTYTPGTRDKQRALNTKHSACCCSTASETASATEAAASPGQGSSLINESQFSMRGLSCYRMYMLEVNLKCHLESKKIKYSLCVKWRNHLYFRYTNMQTPLPCIKYFIKSKFLMIKHVDKYFDTLKKPYVPSTCSLCFWG